MLPWGTPDITGEFCCNDEYKEHLTSTLMTDASVFKGECLDDIAADDESVEVLALVGRILASAEGDGNF
uniref:Uncharacterized protein n=1 Tax=Amphimedon queenslandica TaxID=400682 RepID=A0A1X7T5Z2_AMPQE